jgi:hypothetical protein
MADRIETKLVSVNHFSKYVISTIYRPFANKIDSRLQTLIASPYAQSQLQFAGLV